MNELKTISGLNIAEGIKQHSDNQENYLKVLRSFLVSTNSKIDIIENAQEGSLKQYEITVHGIKGSSRGICADDIAAKASELEKAAVTGDIEYISKNNAAFLNELKKLLDGLKQMFDDMDSKIVKQKKAKPDKELLVKLNEACEIYDMMEVDAAITEICKYQYDTDNELAEWLKQNAEGMQYDIIAERLKSIIKIM